MVISWVWTKWDDGVRGGLGKVCVVAADGTSGSIHSVDTFVSTLALVNEWNNIP